MRTISIPYGKTILPLQLDENRIEAVLEPCADKMQMFSQEELVIRALACPIGSQKVEEMAQRASKILLITSDHTRPVPSHITLPLFLAALRKQNPQAEIRILVATGMHRATTREEMLQKFGAVLLENEKFFIHDSRNEEQLVDKGILPSGGRLVLNKLVDWADLVVSEGFIEPHFFAGFSGGRKSILPGISGNETVRYNHNAKFIAHPKAAQGVLKDNPIHMDMLYAQKAAKLAFILNVVLDEEKKIIAAFAGDPTLAHEEGCAFVLKRTRVKACLADIAVTSNGGYPLDQNIYQSVKGMTAAEATVRQGGVIILCARCNDGHGGEKFYRYFSEANNTDEVMEKILAVPSEMTPPDQWQAQILARVMKKATVIFVTEQENRAYIENMKMLYAQNLETAMEMAEKIVGKNAKITIIPDGVGVIVV